MTDPKDENTTEHHTEHDGDTTTEVTEHHEKHESGDVTDSVNLDADISTPNGNEGN